MRAELALLALVACSSSRGKPIASLSKDEQRQLCEKVAASRQATATLPDFRRVRCSTQALGAAGAPENTTADAMRAACARELDRCLASGPEMPTFHCEHSGGSSLVPSFIDELAGCADLTVDELMACGDETRAMLPLAPPDPCAVTFDPKDPLASYAAFTAKTKGPRCAVVDRKCKRAR